MVQEQLPAALDRSQRGSPRTTCTKFYGQRPSGKWQVTAFSCWERSTEWHGAGAATCSTGQITEGITEDNMHHVLWATPKWQVAGDSLLLLGKIHRMAWCRSSYLQHWTDHRGDHRGQHAPCFMGNAQVASDSLLLLGKIHRKAKQKVAGWHGPLQEDALTTRPMR